MSDPAKGVIATMLACTIWGLSGLYYDFIRHIPALEIMAHRSIWSGVFFMVILAVQGRIFAPFQGIARRSSFLLICVAALMVGFNWLTFVYAVQIGKALEASLGYFMFPLVAVVLGRLVFAEKLGRTQALAVGLVLGAVILLTAGLGVTPWISLSLAISFGLYGMIKKRLDMGPVVSVTAEAMLLIPFALVVLWYYHSRGAGAFASSWHDSLALMASGVMTAFPLILFSYASRKVSLTTLGLLSYLNPSLQFLVATLILQEPFGIWHAIAFSLIWTALVIYSASSWRQGRAARNPVSSS